MFIDGLVLLGLMAGLALAALALAAATAAGMAAENDGTANLRFSAGGAAFNVVWLVLVYLYFALSHCGPKGATLGKRALGMSVTTLSGGSVTFQQASIRFACTFLSTLLLGWGYTRRHR